MSLSSLQHITNRPRRFRAAWAHASELSVASAASAAAVDSAIRFGQPPHRVMYLTHVSDSAQAAADTACAALTAAMFGRAGRPALHRLRSAGTSAVPAA